MMNASSILKELFQGRTNKLTPIRIRARQIKVEVEKGQHSLLYELSQNEAGTLFGVTVILFDNGEPFVSMALSHSFKGLEDGERYIRGLK